MFDEDLKYRNKKLVLIDFSFVQRENKGKHPYPILIFLLIAITCFCAQCPSSAVIYFSE